MFNTISIIFSFISLVLLICSWRTNVSTQKYNLFEKRYNLYKKISERYENQLNKYLGEYMAFIPTDEDKKKEIMKNSYFENQYKKFLDNLSFKDYEAEMVFLFGFNNDFLIEYVKKQNIEKEMLFNIKNYENKYSIMFEIATKDLFKKFLCTTSKAKK